LALMRRMFPRPLMMLCGALGFCSSLALMAAVTVGVDAKSLVIGSQAEPQDKAAKKPEEAPTGFDNKTNGFEKLPSDFDKDREKFEEAEKIEDGLGPVYNATSCVSCHQNPVTGSSSQ